MDLAILLFLVLLRTSQAASKASGSFDCSTYNASETYSDELAKKPNGGEKKRGCLAGMKKTFNKELYDVCKDSREKTCYIFLQEPPFVKFNETVFYNYMRTKDKDLQRPVRCGNVKNAYADVMKTGPDPGSQFGGISMELHARTSSRNDYCMWAGRLQDCSFSQLVDFTEIMATDGYRFAITGLLLETPRRQCEHSPSVPVVDNSMIIIGPEPEQISSLEKIINPFSRGTWISFGGVLVILFFFVVFMVCRFTIWKKRDIYTAFFLFVGDRNQALDNEKHKHQNKQGYNTDFTTKYNFILTWIRIGLFFLLALFAIFYEVSIVNFLFLDRIETLPKRITSLSEAELRKYAVLKDSALENVWNASVRRGGQELGEELPWKNNRCKSAAECFQFVDQGKAEFIVSFEVVGKYLMLSRGEEMGKQCSRLSLVATVDENALYRFNGGWLYNRAVNEARRAKVDRELLGLRIEGATRRLVAKELKGFEKCEIKAATSIGPMVILIPVVVFVAIPVLITIVVLIILEFRICSRKNKQQGDVYSEERAIGKPENSPDDDDRIGKMELTAPFYGIEGW